MRHLRQVGGARLGSNKDRRCQFLQMWKNKERTLGGTGQPSLLGAYYVYAKHLQT